MHTWGACHVVDQVIAHQGAHAAWVVGQLLLLTCCIAPVPLGAILHGRGNMGVGTWVWEHGRSTSTSYTAFTHVAEGN